MYVLFEGVYTISKLAVSGGDDPGSVTKGRTPNLLEFSPSNALTCVLLVHPKGFGWGDVRSASWRRAEQRITEIMHYEVSTVLIN
jgi:hypothetical protein